MIDTVLNLLFPATCVLCDGPVTEWRQGALCPDCEAGFVPLVPPFCERCGLPAPAIEGECGRCLSGHTSFDFGRSALTLTEDLRRTIHEFKYNDRVSLARPLGRALAACREREPFTAGLVIPVPLFARRERERGYNQTVLLASRLSLPTAAGIVGRRRDTSSQTGLTRAERLRNVKGAFESRSPLRGTVLIVDDVMTTGATVNQLAQVLKRAGASRVEVLTLTRVADTAPIGRAAQEEAVAGAD